MKRKITKSFVEWKASKTKKCLLVVGARQVGKTYSIEEFAKENYPSNKIISINFELFPEAKKFFENDLSPKAIMNKIQMNIRFMDIDFKDDENNPYFIFLDEIQSCENALISLKSFSLENKLYHVIASGSLLGVALARSFHGSYPVGYVSHLEMKPFDFEEFLWAFNYSEDFIEQIRMNSNSKDISLSTHETLLGMLRKYIVIGGLPSCILTFLNSNDFHKVYEIQQDLKRGYIQDIRKYAENHNESLKIEKCFASIPFQLKQQNKKFMYHRVEEGGRVRKFKDALDYLYEAGLVTFCYNTKTIQSPLESYKKEESFKLFLFDTGILMSMFHEEKRYLVLNGNDDLDIGGIYENLVANILSLNPYEHELYYYNRMDMDIDFLKEENGKITAIEVKSGNNLKSPSLNKLKNDESKKDVYLLKLSSKIVYEEQDIHNLPFYQFALLNSKK